MKSVIGIVILVICAVGVYSVLRWVFSQASALSSKHLVKQPGQQPKKQKFIRVGHERKLVCYDDLPEANKYKGRTWLGGLPVFADVVVPCKKDYATIIYMDHWFKQYAYDVMCIWKSTCDGFSKEGVGKSWFYALFFPIMFIIAGFSFIKVLIVTSVIFVGLYLWYLPSGMPMERRSGELAKNLTFADWQKIDLDVAKDLAEEERLVSAIRRAGIHRPW